VAAAADERLCLCCVQDEEAEIKLEINVLRQVTNICVLNHALVNL